MQTDGKISKISQYLNEVRQNPNAFWEILSEDDSVYWVDYLDGDEWMIQDIAKYLQLEDLTTVNKAFQNDFYIIYQGQKFKIPYKGESSWRDTTLKALNQLLMPNYDIRLCMDSWDAINNKLLGFIPLTQNEVTILAEKFGEVFEQKLQKLTADSRLFDIEL